MTDHGPQDEFRELTPEEAQEAYDNAPSVPLSKERINEIVAYATGKTTDHGPQRQPASVSQIEAQRKQLQRMAEGEDACGSVTAGNMPQIHAECDLEMSRLDAELARLRAENERLKRLDLTADEFQKLLDSPAYCRAFAEYATKLFGADKSAEAIAACAMQEQWARDLNRVRDALTEIKDHIASPVSIQLLAADALRGEGG